MAILTREIVGGDGLRDERGVVLADPVAPYRRGFEDATYDRCWFCPYLTASRDAEHDAPIWHDRGRTVTALAHTAGVRVEYVHVDMSRQTVERREVTQ